MRPVAVAPPQQAVAQMCTHDNCDLMTVEDKLMSYSKRAESLSTVGLANINAFLREWCVLVQLG